MVTNGSFKASKSTGLQWRKNRKAWNGKKFYTEQYSVISSWWFESNQWTKSTMSLINTKSYWKSYSETSLVHRTLTNTWQSPKYDIRIVLDDCKVKMVGRTGGRLGLGMSFPALTNKNWIILIATCHYVVVNTTISPHKNIHKYT